MSEQTEAGPDIRDALGHLTAQRDWLALIDAAQGARADFPDLWEPHYYESRGLVESGRYEEAEHILQLAMERFPRNKMLTVLYGQAGARFPDREDAIARWKMLLGHMPDLAQLHLGLALSYEAADRVGDADHALADGLAAAPGNAQLLAGRAGLAWERQDWLAALQLWTLLLQMRPDHTEAYTFIATALYKLDRHAESDSAAEDGLARMPDDLDLLSAYAMAAVTRGDLPKAAERWRRLLAIFPSHAFGALGLSRALQRQDQPAEAEQALRDGLRFNPDNDVLLIEYATLATRAGLWTEAAARWSEAHLRCSARLAIYTPYVEALARSGQPVAAETIAAEALRDYPADPALLAMYAGFAAKRGNHAEALARWQVVARHAPGLDAARHGIHDAQRELAAQRRAAIDSPPPDPFRVRLPEPVYQAPPAAEDTPPPASDDTPPPVYTPPPAPEPVESFAPVAVQPPVAPETPPLAADASGPPEPPGIAPAEPSDPAPDAVPAPVERMPQMAPTALDMLFGGAQPPPPSTPAADGLGSKLRRFFRKG